MQNIFKCTAASDYAYLTALDVQPLTITCALALAPQKVHTRIVKHESYYQKNPSTESYAYVLRMSVTGCFTSV